MLRCRSRTDPRKAAPDLGRSGREAPAHGFRSAPASEAARHRLRKSESEAAPMDESPRAFCRARMIAGLRALQKAPDLLFSLLFACAPGAKVGRSASCQKTLPSESGEALTVTSAHTGKVGTQPPATAVLHLFCGTRVAAPLPLHSPDPDACKPRACSHLLKNNIQASAAPPGGCSPT